MVMLGAACSPCCLDCSCLPDEVTVTFSGLTGTITKVDNLLSVTFSAAFGSGAAASVTADGGLPTDGFPISSVTLTNAGSGYALLGRVAPTVSATATPGTGATFTVSLSKVDETPPYWKVGSVAVSGGSGYVNDSAVTFSVASGDTESVAATATLATSRSQPTLTFSAPGGSGLTGTISYSGPTSNVWSVASLAVTNGGSGYTDGDAVTFTLGTDDVEVTPAVATIATGRSQPSISADATLNSSGGSGASLTVTLSQGTDGNGKAIWSVSAIGISAAGSGYAVDEVIVFIVDDGTAVTNGSGKITSVDGSGGITGVSVVTAGSYYKDNGVVASVSVTSGGSYYKQSGTPASVTVSDGGKYWREDATASPYVASVTASIAQTAPSDGTGATLSVTVDSDTSSATFGQIASLTLTNAGTGYLGWSYTTSACNIDTFNGASFLLQQSATNSCQFVICIRSATTYFGVAYPEHQIVVTYNGASTPPTVAISGGIPALNDCLIELSASSADAPFNCAGLAFTAEDVFGGTATVESGNPDGLPDCSALYAADSITVTLTAQDAYRSVEVDDGNAVYYRHESAFHGSDYAGTFTLDYESDVGSARVYRYYYTQNGSTICDDSYLEIQVSDNPPSMSVALLDATRIYNEPYPNAFVGLNALDCDYDLDSDGAAAASCNCSQSSYLASMSHVGFQWNGVDNVTTSTTGSLSVSFSIDSWA